MEGETEVVGVRTGEDGEVRDRRATVDGLKSGGCEESWLEGGDKKHYPSDSIESTTAAVLKLVQS